MSSGGHFRRSAPTGSMTLTYLAAMRLARLTSTTWPLLIRYGSCLPGGWQDQVLCGGAIAFLNP